MRRMVTSQAGCRVCLFAAGLALAMGSGCAPKADSAERFRPIAVGERVPEIAVRTLAGDSVRIAPGEPLTLLNVWATWCGPCVKEFPEMEALNREFAPLGLRIVAVSVDDGGDETVSEFVQQMGATFEIGRDPSGSIRHVYRGIGVPESYLISADGRLLLRQFGAIPDGGAAMREAIVKALSETRASVSRGVRRSSA